MLSHLALHSASVPGIVPALYVAGWQALPLEGPLLHVGAGAAEHEVTIDVVTEVGPCAVTCSVSIGYCGSGLSLTVVVFGLTSSTQAFVITSQANPFS